MARGQLRVYLGAAPGVGKTYAMLGGGHRRLGRGTDVVVPFVETYDRPRTAALLDGLEVLPRRERASLDAVLARRRARRRARAHQHARPGPRAPVAGRRGAAGGRHRRDLDGQHRAPRVAHRRRRHHHRHPGAGDCARRGGAAGRADRARRHGPEALRRRLAHGNVYAPERVDAALANYFRVGNLTALRELALLWLADRVDAAMESYREQHGIATGWPARERVLVALTGGPEGETLIRRAARIAGRGAGGELLGVHVSRGGRLRDGSPRALEHQRTLVESLGGTFHTVVGDDIAAAVLDFARGVNAALVVIGLSRRSRWQAVRSQGVGTTITRLSGPIDVHVVSHEEAGRGLGPPSGRTHSGATAECRGGCSRCSGRSPSPRCSPSPATCTGCPPTCFSSSPSRWRWRCSAACGRLSPPRSLAASCSTTFTPPLHTLTVAELENVFALVVFVVSTVVDLAARRTLQAARSRAESETLSVLAGSVLRGEDTVAAVLGRLRETFAMTSVTLLERSADRAPWRRVGASGHEPCDTPDEGDVEVSVSDNLTLALRGRVPSADDRRVLEAFAAQAAVVLERERLREQVGRAEVLEQGNAIRTALLAAVSHDLRTPLASIKAAVTSLRQSDVEWTPADEAELLATVEDGADRLERLIDNLLDVSRLQTGAVRPMMRAVSLDEVVPRALEGLPPGRVRLEVPEPLPLVDTDPGLLERAVANIAENAVKHAAGAEPVLVAASALSGTVQLRVVDRGAGVAEADKQTMFQPFQRLGDAPGGTGVGLGLAVARGFVEAVGGTLTAEDTRGGGLTMVLSLPAAHPSAVQAP